MDRRHHRVFGGLFRFPVVCFVFRWFVVMVSFKNWIFDLVWLLFRGG
jgi:hypothetical protein